MSNLFPSHHFASAVQSSGVGIFAFYVIGWMLVSVCRPNIDFHGFPFQSGIISSTSSESYTFCSSCSSSLKFSSSGWSSRSSGVLSGSSSSGALGAPPGVPGFVYYRGCSYLAGWPGDGFLLPICLLIGELTLSGGKAPGGCGVAWILILVCSNVGYVILEHRGRSIMVAMVGVLLMMCRGWTFSGVTGVTLTVGLECSISG